MKKIAAALSLAGLVAIGLMASPAAANDADVIKEGSCSLGSDWKLKLSPENGQVEVEFEVDQNVVDQVWKVTLSHNGTVFFKGQRTTKAPSGSFEVRKVVPNLAGPDTVTAKAKNVLTGETCTGRVTADF